MPFTFSHPALIIPLLHQRRRYPWLSATGLIVGSIAPDFEKFFRLKLANSHSHTVASIFYFSCPVGLGLAFLFHLVVRRPLLLHLPPSLHHRLAWLAPVNWLPFFRRYYAGVLLSICIGAALHLFWDSFTHPSDLMAKQLPSLREVVWIGNTGIEVFKLLAVLSTLAGAWAIVWAIWRMPIRPVGPPPSLDTLGRYWGLALGLAAALLIEWVLVVEPRLLNIGIAAISATLLGIVVASVYVRFARVHGRA